ncbi:hypothetical protein, partial [Pseudoalteromonas piscicida]|uniref:hypothetical protein n=1 Tax=Pseudoalteromonas piscicida TaxID=43662 RepID=UPI001A8F4874
LLPWCGGSEFISRGVCGHDLVVHDYISTCLQHLVEQPDDLDSLLIFGVFDWMCMHTNRRVNRLLPC